MHRIPAALTLIIAFSCATAMAHASDNTERRALNGGQLLLEGVPPIPAELPSALDRFQQLRSDDFLGWTADGRHIRVRRRAGGVQQVQQVDQAGGPARPLTLGDEPVREVVRQHRGRLLAFTTSEGGSGFDQIHLLDPETGATRPLTDGDALNNRMVWDRADRHLAFRSTRRNGRSNDLWILDIDEPSGARLLFEAPDGALWKPVSFSRDDRQLLVQRFRSVNDSSVHLLDLATAQMREVAPLAGTPTGNVAIDFDAGGQGVFFVTNRRGRGAEIAWAPLAGNGAPRFAGGSIGWDITEFALSPDGRRGAFLSNENGVSRLYLFDPRRFRHRRVEGLPLGVIDGLVFSPDGRRLGMSVSTPVTPGEAWVAELGLFKRSVRRLQRWTRGDVGGLERGQLVSPRLFHYPAPDPHHRDAAAGAPRDTKDEPPGVPSREPLWIPAFAYVPPGAGPFPVVIYIHGGPEGQFRPSFNPLVQQWASGLGVAVLAPNVRGSLGYGLAYLSMDDGRLREDAVHDIGALLDWIDAAPELDGERVAVYGASYGGYMALASAVHYSDRLVAAVDRAGISHFPTYLENTGDYRRDRRRAEYGDERDPEMRAFLDSISPLNNVDRIGIPLLIVQGQNDPAVPAGQSEKMVRALRQRGQEVWYLNALNEGHWYEKKENLEVFQQVTWLFLRRHLLGD